MSMLSPFGHRDDDSRFARTAAWFSHHRWQAIGVGVAAYVADAAVDSSWTRLVATVGTLPLIGQSIAEMRHMRMLCVRCGHETPVNPTRRCQQRRRTLRTFHLTMVGIPLAAICLLFCLMFVDPLWVIVIPLWTMLGVQAYLIQVHRPLQPWCPFCNWDEGGDPEEVPDPDPSLRRTLTT